MACKEDRRQLDKDLSIDAFFYGFFFLQLFKLCA